jgi:glycosyltransferase involved in cell wall biosynthesis
MIAQSPFQKRFHMLGWRPWAEVADYYRESDVGFNIDALHYETIFGTRTRLVEMLGAGLPVITSLGCELSELVGDYGAGLTFDSGDWQGMGEQILAMANDKKLYDCAVQKAVDYADNTLSFASTTASVRDWVQHPTLAPDHNQNNVAPWSDRLEYKARAIIRQLIWQFKGQEK